MGAEDLKKSIKVTANQALVLMKKFEYSYAEIAEASGKAPGSVRVDITRGVFNPESLKSTAVYVVTGMLNKEKK